MSLRRRFFVRCCSTPTSRFYDGCAKMLDIGGNWNTLSYTSIQNIQTCSMGDMSGRWSSGPSCGKMLSSNFVIKVWHSLDLWCFQDNWELRKKTRLNHEVMLD